MANTLILKKSSVPSKVPLASDLQVGELAVNLSDKKLYSKDAGGTVIELGGSAGTSAYTRYTYTATASQTTFSATYTVGYVNVFINGVMLAPDDYTATNGSTIVLATGASSGDIVDILAWTLNPLTIDGYSAYTRYSYTATAGQTTFNAAYAVGYVTVYFNGVMLPTTDYTATNGTSVVFNTGVSVGDIVEIIAWTVSEIPTVDAANVTGTFPYVAFDTTPATTPTDEGSLYWDSADGNATLSLVMSGGEVVQQIGEEQYYRIKASSAITNGQVVMFTGTVGASGGLTGAPATGLTASTASYVMGIATQDIALNSWGYITSFGLVRNIDTSAFTAGDILYYNPSVTGGLTTTIPSAPNAKIQVCACVYSSASNGSLFVRPSFGGALGQYEGDVQITSPSNGQALVYDGSKWTNQTLNALPSQTGNTGKILTTDGTNASWTNNYATTGKTIALNLIYGL